MTVVFDGGRSSESASVQVEVTAAPAALAFTDNLFPSERLMPLNLLRGR